MRGKLSFGWLIVLLLGSVWMVACSSEYAAVLEVPREVGSFDKADERDSLQATEIQPENDPTQSNIGEVVIESTPVVNLEIPELKTELTATDPETVNLISGEIQLVEFFAFW